MCFAMILYATTKTTFWVALQYAILSSLLSLAPKLHENDSSVYGIGEKFL